MTSDRRSRSHATSCKRRDYVTTKNKTNTRDRLELKKFCKWCRETTPHRKRGSRSAATRLRRAGGLRPALVRVCDGRDTVLTGPGRVLGDRRPMLDGLKTPLELEGAELGPVPVAVTSDRIGFYVDVTGEDPAGGLMRRHPGLPRSCCSPSPTCSCMTPRRSIYRDSASS